MIEINHESTNYSQFLLVLAKHFKCKIANGYMKLPSMVGEGVLWAKELPCGISIMYADCKFREDVLFCRNGIMEQSYILLFHEVKETPEVFVNRHGAFNMLKEMVLLSNATVSNRYFVPAKARLRSFRIMFKKSHLTQFIDEHFINQTLDHYFLNIIKAGSREPLNFDYRVILDDVMRESFDQPLLTNFLQNRSLLLLETFMKKISAPKISASEKVKLNDNELLRLMKVESMLVGDYETAPPNIQYLSRVCAMSPTKLKNDFKSMYGMPIYEYYQKNRMQRAKSLLLEGDHSIKEVGKKVGYSNLSHFAGSFKKEFGVLPSQFLSPDALV